MSFASEVDPLALGTVLADADGPSGIRRGDRLFINEDQRANGLRAFETTRGVVVARTPPPDATHVLGRVLSLARPVD